MNISQNFISNKKDLYGGKGGGVPGAKYLGTVKKGDTSFPTPTNDGDYVKVNPSSELPFTIQGITFTTPLDQAIWDKPNSQWILNPGAVQDTSEIPVVNKNQESISGNSTTQQQINIENVNFLKPIIRNFTNTKIVQVSHLLNKYPSVKILDTNNSEIYGVITYPTLNDVRINFDINKSGKVIVNY